MMDANWQKYCEAKQSCPEAILLYRTGDYYECFGDDAVVAARVLLLSRTVGSRGHQMTGFPSFHLEANVRKLVASGRRVAVAEPQSQGGRNMNQVAMPAAVDPVAHLERKADAFQAAVDKLLRREVVWLHNGLHSAGIVADDGDEPWCVIIRHHDPATGEDRSQCWLPEDVWRAAPDHRPETRGELELCQLVADVMNIVRLARREF